MNGKIKLVNASLSQPLGRTLPTKLCRTNNNPFEVAESEISNIKPAEMEIIHMASGAFQVDNINKKIIGLKGKEQVEYTIASIIPIEVTIYIDMILENRVFYGIKFQRIDRANRIETMELEGDILEITNQIIKMGYVAAPTMFRSALNLLVEKILKTDNGTEERGIFRKGIFYNETTDSLFLSKIEYTKPSPIEVKEALECLDYYIQTLFRGKMVDNLGMPVYKELREIIVTCLKWSLVAPLGFATKMKYGENANKEFKYPILLGDTDTYKTSILEMVLSIWGNYGKTVIAAGNLDTEKQLAERMGESTLPFCGDEAGHILTQHNIVTLLKTATVDKILRTRMYEGVHESSLALRSPSLTTNDKASGINETILNRYLLIVITYSMSFYKTLTKEEKEKWKREKIHFSDKLNPIARYLFWYFENITGASMDEVMIGDNNSAGTVLLDKLYSYAEIEKPEYMNDYYEEPEILDDPELKDQMFIKDAFNRYAFKYVKDARYNNEVEDAIQLIVSKSDWLYYDEQGKGGKDFYIVNGVQHISHLQGMFTYKQLREKMGKPEVRMPKTIHKKRPKSFTLSMTEFEDLFL
jgi:hypothetical protein